MPGRRRRVIARVLPALARLRPDARGGYVPASIVPGDGVAPSRPARAALGGARRRARELRAGARALVAGRPAPRLEVAGEQPGRAAWDRLVGLFAGAVGRGGSKGRPRRRVGLRSPLELDPLNALRRLAAADRRARTFAFVAVA